MAKHFPFWVPFLEYIVKYSDSSLLPPFYRTGLYNQSNIQLKKIAAACAIYFLSGFCGHCVEGFNNSLLLGKTVLPFFQEHCWFSVSIAQQTKNFWPLASKPNVFQKGFRWILPRQDLIYDDDCLWKVDPSPYSVSVLRKSRSPFYEQLIF